MIIKGNRHSNGAKLAAYLMSGGKHGERVEHAELNGFGPYPDDIFKAFRSLHVMAGATGIENPLFHVQIRLPEGEQISREQWDHTTARTLKTLGLDGQPYARVFHADEITGEQHIHLAISLIDAETMKAKAVPFFKLRMKALARELEKEFDITRVKNHREGPIKYAAKKNEQQQAQRLGTDKDAIRNTIRACFEQSKNWPTFEAALEHEGMMLTLGDRRSLVVVDHAGGVHAFGKRLLGINNAQIVERLAGLDPNELPTVQQAQSVIREMKPELEPESPRPEGVIRMYRGIGSNVWPAEHGDALFFSTDPSRAAAFGKLHYVDVTAAEMAKFERPHSQRILEHESTAKNDWRTADPAIIARLKPLESTRMNAPENLKAQHPQEERRQKKQPNWNRDRANQAWEDAVMNAAIEQEKTARQFVDPKPEKETRAGGREKGQPEAYVSYGEARIRDAHTAAMFDKRAREGDPVPNAKALADALEQKGIAFAVVLPDESYRSHREQAFARAIGRKSDAFEPGEVVAVTEPRPERLRAGEWTEPPRVHKLDPANAEKYLEILSLDKSKLKGIDATKAILETSAQDRAAYWQDIRLERATNINRFAPVRSAKETSAALGNIGGRAIGSVFSLGEKLFDALFSILDPPTTPLQRHQAAEKARDERETEAERSVDFSKYTTDRAQERQNHQEQQAARDRQREPELER